ncbi:hypothetical protein [Legionella hackeliae]|uniref:hypothetical protein n=1 Tax=Legionella hackeliae TaxID=449 RepID=UPI0015598DD0
MNKQRKKLAKYLAIPSFEHVTFGEGGNYAEVAAEFAKVLEQRLTKNHSIKRTTRPPGRPLSKRTLYCV